ncbi:MAG: ATP-binding protein [Armatimonadetes bacterium]|nr:ATP-binding protein [Armatimonadota bacterium]
MYISRLHIRNFRSIPEITIVPREVEGRQMVVLIGENNSGKTNVLEALNWALNPERSVQFLEVTEQDFHKPGQPLVIEVEFSRPDAADHAVFADYFDLTASGGGEEEKLNLRFQCVYNPETEEYEKSLTINERQPRAMSARERRAIPFYYLKASRDASDTRVSSQTLFGRLIHSIHIDRQTPSMSAALEEANRALMGNRDVVTIADELGRVARRTIPVVGEGSALTMALSASDPNEMKRSIRLYLRESEESRALPLDRFGLGTQSTVVIATFIAFARRGQLKNATLGIDEPESHLHPQAQRHMLSDLTALSETNQVWIATHSTHFLARLDPRHLALLHKKDGATVACQLEEEFPQETLTDLQAGMDPSLSEIFFARGVALTDSETEAAALPALARALSYDFDRLGLSAVYEESREQREAIRRVLTAFRIPVCLASDLRNGLSFEEAVCQDAESLPVLKGWLGVSEKTAPKKTAEALLARSSRATGLQLASLLGDRTPESIRDMIEAIVVAGR